MTLRLTKAVFNDIIHTLGSLAPERGGVLGASADGVICEYYFDKTSIPEPDSYCPDIEQINRVLVEDWAPRNIFLAGIIHSHEASTPFLSCGDLAYGKKFLLSLEQEECAIYMPVVIAEPFRIISYRLSLKNKRCLCKKTEIIIV